MRRYLIPAGLYLAALAALIVGWNGEVLWMIGLGGCAFASVWWVVVAARAPKPVWPHLVALLVLLVLPGTLILQSLEAMEDTDAAGIGVLLLMPFLAALLLPPVLGVFILLARIIADAEERARLPGQ